MSQGGSCDTVPSAELGRGGHCDSGGNGGSGAGSHGASSASRKVDTTAWWNSNRSSPEIKKAVHVIYDKYNIICNINIYNIILSFLCFCA